MAQGSGLLWETAIPDRTIRNESRVPGFSCTANQHQALAGAGAATTQRHRKASREVIGSMDPLTQLEKKSVDILREAYSALKNLCMLWWVGKETPQMVWPARKGSLGHVPFA